jgi:hypothetical protein
MDKLYDEIGEEWVQQSQREERLNVGVAGIHSVMPFQCEKCWFQNLEGRAANWKCPKDYKYIQCLRRASLDAMAGKANGTPLIHTSVKFWRMWSIVR